MGGAAETDIAEWTQRFLRFERELKGASPHTLRNYASDLRMFAAVLQKGGHPMRAAEIDRLTVRSYLASLMERGGRRASVARRMAALRSFCRFLCREGVLQSNPARLVESPSVPRTLPKVPGEQEMETLLNSPYPPGPSGTRDRAVFEALYGAGLRVSELSALNLEDVDLDSRIFAVRRGKGGKERRVPFGPPCAAALREWLACRESVPAATKNPAAEPRALFLNRRGGRLLPGGVRHVLRRRLLALAASGRYSPHALRHAFATHMLRRGADLRAIQEMLGHASLAATERYTHLKIEDLRRVHDSAHPRSGAKRSTESP